MKPFFSKLPKLTYATFPGDSGLLFAMFRSFDCSFDKLGLGSSLDTDRGLLSRLREFERLRRGGERLSLPFEPDRSRRTGDFLERLPSRRTGDFLLRLRERSLRGSDFLSRFLEPERSRRTSDFLSRLFERSLLCETFLERLLSLRPGDFLGFLSRERLRRSLDLLRLSLDRLRLSRGARAFSTERPRERRAGFEFSSFDFSFAASFFILSLISIAFFIASSGSLIVFSGTESLSLDVLRLMGLADRFLSRKSFRFKISSFFCSMSSRGMPVSESCADNNRAQSSSMKILEFLPLRNPVR